MRQVLTPQATNPTTQQKKVDIIMKELHLLIVVLDRTRVSRMSRESFYLDPRTAAISLTNIAYMNDHDVGKSMMSIFAEFAHT